MLPPNYTVQELCQYLRVHENTVYRWISDGVFPNAFQIGRDWRIPLDDVQQATKLRFKPVPLKVIHSSPP